MPPTVGRIVHYKNTQGEIYAALITKVWSDTCVNLAIFLHDGSGLSGATSVVYGDDYLQWSWPPRV